MASVTFNCPTIAPASSLPVPVVSPAMVAASFVVLTVISISLVSVFPSSSVIVTVNLSVPLKEARENFEKEYLTTQLKKFGGNISKTAKFVGMERSALHRKLKGLGVKDLN